jgi:hypothetical protein
LRQFKAEYQLYKDNFDLEMMMTATRTTYAELKEQANKADEWL